jgi:hypothetical protein
MEQVEVREIAKAQLGKALTSNNEMFTIVEASGDHHRLQVT